MRIWSKSLKIHNTGYISRVLPSIRVTTFNCQQIDGILMTERPLGITILGALWIILGLVYFAIGMGFAFMGIVISGLLGSVGGIFVLIGIVDFVLGVGCFMAWPWVSTVSVAFTVLHIIIGIREPALNRYRCAARADHPVYHSLLPAPTTCEGIFRENLKYILLFVGYKRRIRNRFGVLEIFLTELCRSNEKDPPVKNYKGFPLSTWKSSNYLQYNLSPRMACLAQNPGLLSPPRAEILSR